ncbi:MAG: hypothetical protein ACJAW1_002418 [Glaciecola sp.]
MTIHIATITTVGMLKKVRLLLDGATLIKKEMRGSMMNKPMPITSIIFQKNNLI